MFMAKAAVSVTLDTGNLMWLKARTGAAGLRSVSELLDQIVTAARASGGGPIRSVVGTVDLDASDSRLEHADKAVRRLVEASVRRPLVFEETSPGYDVSRRSPKKRRG
jgi:hypothetical protein